MTEQGIAGEHPLAPIDPLQQRGRDRQFGGGFVPHAGDRFVGQHQAGFMTKGAQGMHRAARRRREAQPPSLGLAVDGDALAAGRRGGGRGDVGGQDRGQRIAIELPKQAVQGRFWRIGRGKQIAFSMLAHFRLGSRCPAERNSVALTPKRALNAREKLEWEEKPQARAMSVTRVVGCQSSRLAARSKTEPPNVGAECLARQCLEDAMEVVTGRTPRPGRVPGVTTAHPNARRCS